MRILTLVALFGLLSFSVAEDKKTDKQEEKKEKADGHPKGKFVKSVNNLEISWEFKKDDILVFRMADGNNGCTLEAKVKYEKDGLVKCKTESFSKEGNFPIEKEKGYEFRFKYKLDGKKVIISDLEGADIDDNARETVGGEYEEKASDK
jgi:hypothetical protein